jgi:hypothetical protein
MSSGARSNSSFTLPADISTARAWIEASVHSVPRLTVTSASADSITVRGRVNWKTWGETIEISLVPVSAGETDVVIRSNPIVTTTVIDFGQGAKDVRNLVAAIWERLPGAQSDTL